MVKAYSLSLKFSLHENFFFSSHQNLLLECQRLVNLEEKKKKARIKAMKINTPRGADGKQRIS